MVYENGKIQKNKGITANPKISKEPTIEEKALLSSQQDGE